jgi:predicted RNA binding protein YcfA (HicA-like mRNA interferase family)
MARLPLLSGVKAAKAFSRSGWSAARQTGSHLIMIKQGSMLTLSIPMHNEIDR